MKTLLLQLRKADQLKGLFYALLFTAGLSITWQLLPLLLQLGNATVGLVDAGIWQLLLFTIICWLIILLLSYSLLGLMVRQLGLPSFHLMVLQFKDLQSWQQLSLYYAGFALLLLSAVGCLVAVF